MKTRPIEYKNSSIKRYGKYLIFAIYCLVLLEILSRVYFVIRYDASFIAPTDSIYHFYPELLEVEEENQNSEAEYKVLMLGGSVLNPEFGSIGEVLEQRLSNSLGKTVKLFNLAEMAHTSLDSYYKYKLLEDYKFDLVILYHGINELRANNCPPELFKLDYSHYGWYAELNTLSTDTFNNLLTLPIAFKLIYAQYLHSSGRKEVFDPSYIKDEWLKFGFTIKTAEAFAINYKKIIDLAESKTEKLVLASYAFYLPLSYNLSDFKKLALEYSDNKYPVEIWGHPGNVRRGLKEHNQVIASLHLENPQTFYVDQNLLIPKRKLYFNDACHLTDSGCVKFVDNLLEVIELSNQ